MIFKRYGIRHDVHDDCNVIYVAETKKKIWLLPLARMKEELSFNVVLILRY